MKYVCTYDRTNATRNTTSILASRIYYYVNSVACCNRMNLNCSRTMSRRAFSYRSPDDLLRRSRTSFFYVDFCTLYTACVTSSYDNCFWTKEILINLQKNNLPCTITFVHPKFKDDESRVREITWNLLCVGGGVLLLYNMNDELYT